jgi:hypothetical protein
VRHLRVEGDSKLVIKYGVADSVRLLRSSHSVRACVVWVCCWCPPRTRSSQSRDRLISCVVVACVLLSPSRSALAIGVLWSASFLQLVLGTLRVPALCASRQDLR